MFSRLIARSLIAIVPEKRCGVVILQPDSASPITVQVFSAWLKPMNVNLSQYGGVNLQGDETRINIPQHELNPLNDGREIRPRDQIEIGGMTYIVLTTMLKSVRTRWECVVRKVLN